jgi:uncharacterized protein (DUF1778 family)
MEDSQKYSKVINLRLTDHQYYIIKKAAKKSHLQISVYIRKLVLDNIVEEAKV